MIRPVTTLLLSLALAACTTTAEEPIAPLSSVLSTKSAKVLFAEAEVGSDQKSEPLGGYSRGCLAGGVQLPETGPTWQAMRLSRNRNWGHPEVIDYIKKLSVKAAAQPGWNGIYVGDISPPRGGPHSGHASHQIGLDADFWMLPADKLDLTPAERESLSSISMRRQNGAFVNSDWTPAHHEVLKAAASDPRVTRIFVFPGAKVQMCNDETGNRAYLRKIRPWYGHHYHFHVRLACPRNAKDCVEQTPPPPGDGCDEAQGWVDRILNPPPPDPNAPPPKPRPELTMADLPAQCSRVLTAN